MNSDQVVLMSRSKRLNLKPQSEKMEKEKTKLMLLSLPLEPLRDFVFCFFILEAA